RSEVSRGPFLLGAVQQALREGDIGRILAGPADVLLGRGDGRLHLAGARLNRRRLIKRLPARIAVRPAVRDVGFAERAAGHGSPMGCPSDMEGDDSFECRVRGVVDNITLSGPVAQIFTGLNVVDSDGEFVGIVRDTNEADDVLDSFIVEDEQGEMVNVLMEDVRSIDEWVELSVSGDSLYEK